MAEADPHKTFNVHDAKSNLSKLMDRADAGEEVVLAKAGVPWAKVVPLAPPPKRNRQPGGCPSWRIFLTRCGSPHAGRRIAAMGRKAAGKIRTVTALPLNAHAALFWWAGSNNLSVNARDAISDEDMTILLSAASCWEIATKFRIGWLGLVGDPLTHVPRLMGEHGFHPLPVSVEHGLRTGA